MTDAELAIWTSAHDNGWIAVAAENPDGTWSAWAAPKGETVPVEYIEDDAALAVLSALASTSPRGDECKYAFLTHKLLTAPHQTLRPNIPSAAVHRC
jgi:hypothetical protein